MHDIEDTPGSWVPKNVLQHEFLANLAGPGGGGGGGEGEGEGGAGAGAGST